MSQLPFSTCMVSSKQLIAVEDLPLVEIERSFSWSFDGVGWSFTISKMLVCPRCLRCWAHMAFQPKDQHFYIHPGCLQPTPAFCSNCAPGFEGGVPGSILDAAGGTDMPLLYALPVELLHRELELHLKQAEREMGLGQQQRAVGGQSTA